LAIVAVRERSSATDIGTSSVFLLLMGLLRAQRTQQVHLETFVADHA
jgi:hypothetical protein